MKTKTVDLIDLSLYQPADGQEPHRGGRVMNECIVDNVIYITKVVEGEYCNGCAGKGNFLLCKELGECNAYYREDSEWIIWIKKDSNP